MVSGRYSGNQGLFFNPHFSSTLWYSVETGCIAAFGEMFRFERGWTADIKRIHYRSDLIDEFERNIECILLTQREYSLEKTTLMG